MRMQQKLCLWLQHPPQVRHHTIPIMTMETQPPGSAVMCGSRLYQPWLLAWLGYFFCVVWYLALEGVVADGERGLWCWIHSLGFHPTVMVPKERMLLNMRSMHNIPRISSAARIPVHLPSLRAFTAMVTPLRGTPGDNKIDCYGQILLVSDSLFDSLLGGLWLLPDRTWQQKLCWKLDGLYLDSAS